MTYETHPPEVSKSGRVVTIDGGKASEMARIGNKAEAARYAAEMARVHPNKRAGGTAHGPAGGARGMASATPAAEAGVSRVAAESKVRELSARPGLDFRPGDSATSSTIEDVA